MVQMQREVQNLSVSPATAVAIVMVTQFLINSVTLSTNVINATHSIVQYLANFASGFARALTIYTR